MKKAVKGLIFGAVLGGVGILCAAVFSRFGTSFQDLCFYIGIVLLVLGLFAMQKGSPTTGIFTPYGGSNASGEAHWNASVAMQESQNTVPYKFRQNRVLEFNPASLAMLLAAALLFAALGISYLLK